MLMHRLAVRTILRDVSMWTMLHAAGCRADEAIHLSLVQVQPVLRKNEYANCPDLRNNVTNSKLNDLLLVIRIVSQ